MKCAEDMLSFVGSVERVMGKLQQNKFTFLQSLFAIVFFQFR